jgi:hypothetical protein
MKNNFEKNNYCVVKNAIPKDIATFCFNYLIVKRKVFNTFHSKNLLDIAKLYGTWGDGQVDNTFSSYGDIAMETLLVFIKPKLEKVMGKKLIETYSYTRLYKNGDILKRHIDRESCRFSTTLNLGGDPWPIFLDPTKGRNKKGIKVNLKPGDMLVYKGCELEHWREQFTGNICGQVFLHYNEVSSNKENNKFDGREHLGLPFKI